LQVIDWQIIIEKHGPAVWQTAYRLLGNYEDASDCFQETFICALKVSNRQRVKNFPALLVRLATTRAIDQLRRRIRREPNNSIIDYESDASNNNPDPAKLAQQQELAEKLRKALVKLPVQEAQVFCLRYLNDMSYRKIARELEIDTNTVGVLLYRAKEKLRKSLAVFSKEQKSEVTL
jgi:RNA polymerase sigma factor (sigma-70 family)